LAAFPTDFLRAQGRKAAVENTRIQTADYEGVVFAAENRAFAFVFPPPAVAWTPTPEDITRVEELMADHVRRKAPGIFEKLRRYKRQYAGYLQAGKKVVYVNCFCRVRGDVDWEKTELLVADGGPDFFHVTVDLSGGACYDFVVNGSA